MIIDSHAHVFPTRIAAAASQGIADFYEMPVRYDGTVETLLHLGDEAGVDKFLIQSVATTPHQVCRINTFIIATVQARPNRFIGFATLHPHMMDMEQEFERCMSSGLRGVKVHPDFQDCPINDRALYPIYELCEGVCPILMHTGDNRFHRSSPVLVPEVLRDFPRLQMVCAHFGGWSEWNDAEDYLPETTAFIDTSSTLYDVSIERAEHLVHRFGVERIFFGTDYPMWNPAEELKRFDRLRLTDDEKEKILGTNLLRFLHMDH